MLIVVNLCFVLTRCVWIRVITLRLRFGWVILLVVFLLGWFSGYGCVIVWVMCCLCCLLWYD